MTMGSTVSTIAHIAQRNRKTNALLLQYADAKGELQETFKSMRVSPNTRLSWLQLWKSMDEDGSKLLDYSEFIQACGLADNMWSWRMFNLLDRNFVGCVDFFTFFSSIPRFLVFDRLNAIEVAFRMCSRRGATCEPKNAVLDEKDIRLFVEARYPMLDRRHALLRAVDILAHLDDDCSGGVSFEEFEQFCNVNPVFLAAVRETLQSMRHAIFGEQFWKDFTNKARFFDESTQREIFCSSEALMHSSSGPPTSVPAAPAPKRVAAATKRQLKTMASVVAKKRKHNVDQIGSLVRAAAGELKRIASESSIGRHLVSEDATDKAQSLTARAKEAGVTLRRIVSDSDLANAAKRQGGDLPNSLKEALTSTHRWAQTLKCAEIRSSLRNAGQRASERLADRAREISGAGGSTRQMPTENVNKAQEPLAGGARKAVISTGVLLAADMKRAGRLKAVASVAVGVRRMQDLATAARKEREKTVLTLKSASLGSLVSALPHQLPDAQTTRAMGKGLAEATKAASGRALEALRDAVRNTAIARHISDTPAENRRRKRDADRAGHLGMSSSGQEKGGPTGGDTNSEDGLLCGEYSLSEERPKKSLTGAEVKAAAKDEQERRWATTEQFYARLSTAAERLEASRTQEGGYDFSADFPKLWCASLMHGSHGDRETRQQRKRRSSASRKTAKVYMRFIALWQERGPGRSKLAVAFNRWRLHTCDAMVEEDSTSMLDKGREGYALDDATPDDGARAPRYPQSIKEMWEAAGRLSDERDLHAIIMTKARVDRLFPWELCQAYEQDMVERINRRQTENNVPILPMPFC